MIRAHGESSAPWLGPLGEGASRPKGGPWSARRERVGAGRRSPSWGQGSPKGAAQAQVVPHSARLGEIGERLEMMGMYRTLGNAVKKPRVDEAEEGKSKRGREGQREAVVHALRPSGPLE